MALLGALLLAFVPAFLMAAFVYWLDRYEKEPLIMLGAAFVWGAIVAAGGAFLLNTVFGIGIYALTGSGEVADQATSDLVAPFVEEALKAGALLVIFLAFRGEFDSILDGIIYAGVTALGFAATENVQYIYEHGYLSGGWEGFWQLALIRILVVAWQHPFYTAFTGIGLAFARLHKGLFVKLVALSTGYATAVFTHAFHNSFIDLVSGPDGFALGSLIDWLGWLLMGVFVLFMIARERGLLQRQLKDEVPLGIMSETQYHRALSPWTMSLALLSGGPAAARFYRLCGELAHKKEQMMRLGDEQGNIAAISSAARRTDRARSTSAVSRTCAKFGTGHAFLCLYNLCCCLPAPLASAGARRVSHWGGRSGTQTIMKRVILITGSAGSGTRVRAAEARGGRSHHHRCRGAGTPVDATGRTWLRADPAAFWEWGPNPQRGN